MISCKGLTKKFNHRAIAGLHGVDLTLNNGEVLAIMGPNGGGKSTLINIMAGQMAPDAGSCECSGEVTLFKTEDKLPAMNVQKYLISRINLDADDEKKIQLTRDLADIFEFTFQLRQQLPELSAGQRQKVLLASCLINRPALLLLDEPFTHLDPHTRKEILKALFNYIRHHETSVVWVTHDLEDAFSFSDRVAILNFGKFEQLATPLKMLANPANLFVAQFLGYENFLPVKKTAHGWLTPWGLLKSEQQLPKDEAILVIPTTALKFASEGVSMKLVGEELKGLERRMMLEWDGRKMYCQIPAPAPTLPKESMVTLKAELNECLLLPL